MKIRPLRDHVLIEPMKEEVEKGGIILPDTAQKERSEQGKVIAVGPGRYEDGKLVEPTVKKGDVVVFTKYGPNEITIDDEEYLIAEEKDILAIVEPKKK